VLHPRARLQKKLLRLLDERHHTLERLAALEYVHTRHYVALLVDLKAAVEQFIAAHRAGQRAKVVGSVSCQVRHGHALEHGHELVGLRIHYLGLVVKLLEVVFEIGDHVLELVGQCRVDV